MAPAIECLNAFTMLMDLLYCQSAQRREGRPWLIRRGDEWCEMAAFSVRLLYYKRKKSNAGGRTRVSP
jgi:hypothetical protein